MNTDNKMQSRPHVLIVDDDEGACHAHRMILETLYEVEIAEDGDTALRKVSEQPFDLVLLDVRMHGKDGIQVLRELRQLYPLMPVIMISALNDAPLVVEAMKLGASNYEVKPVDVEKLRIDCRQAIENYRLQNRLALLQSEIAASYKFESIIGSSAPMKKVCSIIQRVADTDSTILIEGESGTGKELVARELHYNSSRRNHPFIALDCGAVAKELIESELFGHEKGAFTGALTQRVGLFEAAQGGTLFLDEIGEMEIGLQSRLLRVLQERQIRRVGSNKSIDVNVRLIAATSRNLPQQIAAGRFREDLYYRINVVPIPLPPLRERPEDIPLLIKHFTEKLLKSGQVLPEYHPDTIEALITYPWPGNVRELRNCIERLLVLNEGKKTITPEDLPSHFLKRNVPSSMVADQTMGSVTPMMSPQKTEFWKDKPLEQAVAELERAAILDAMQRAGGVLSRAAVLLGTTRRILKYKIDKLNLKIEDNAEGDTTDAAAA